MNKIEEENEEGKEVEDSFQNGLCLINGHGLYLIPVLL